MTLTTHSLHVSCSAEGDEINEAQLLAEAEELLMSLDPIAFVEMSETHSSASANTSCSSDNSTSTSGSQSTPHHITTMLPGTRKRVLKPGALRNPSRERQQHELASLRKQVLVLENDLQNIQERQATTASSSKESKVAMTPIWERIAKRQLVTCERAVSDNKRLKSMIKLQKELVVSMEETLYNWQRVAAPQPGLLSSLNHPVPHKNVHIEPGDDLLFAMLVSELDATYLRIDEAFHEAGLHQTDTIEPHTRATPKTLVAIDGRRRSFFELVEVEFSPFDYEMVSRASKICGAKQSESPDCVIFKGDWDSGSVITEKHRLKRVYNGVEIAVHMLLALKEYEFEDQIVCVWRCIFKCEEDQFPDAYVQENGWFIAANVASQSTVASRASPTGSVSRMCVHLEPKRFTAPSAGIRAEADTMTNLVMNSYHDDMQEMNDMLENMLIEESLKQKSPSNRSAVAG